MHILDYSREKLEQYFISVGEKKFKALQVFEWIYEKKEYNFDNFSNLKKEVREKLKEDFPQKQDS